MFRILSASKDTMITNKIINNSFRAEDANTGQAGTLDLFKLYDESSLTGSTTPIELSRVLIKFDLDPLRALTSSILNVGSSNFKCFLNLRDVYGGQTTPTNFTLSVMPLSKSFDEGFGRDVVLFQDLDSANYVTASTVGGISAWNVTGASAVGLLGTSNIDVVGSGTLDASQGLISFEATQLFPLGDEDLLVDVTRIVSATLKGLLPDQGFRISFSGTQETDDKTRFVKRFASRHATNVRKRPTIRAIFDDSSDDDHQNFFFDLSGSLFLNNFHRGSPANLVSGSNLTPLTGTNALLMTLYSGSYTGTFTASQHTTSGQTVTGVYSTSFAIPSNNSSLLTEIRAAGSATFTEVWSSFDRTVAFVTNSLVVKTVNRTTFDVEQQRWNINVTNMREFYKRTEKARFRIFAQLISTEQSYKAKRLPYELPSEIIRDIYYRIRDAHSGDIVVPFEQTYRSTRVSTDSKGMYFDLYIDGLDAGRVYEIDLLVYNRGVSEIYSGVGGRFRVED